MKASSWFSFLTQRTVEIFYEIRSWILDCQIETLKCSQTPFTGKSAWMLLSVWIGHLAAVVLRALVVITDGVAATDTSGDGPHRMGQRHEAPLINQRSSLPPQLLLLLPHLLDKNWLSAQAIYYQVASVWNQFDVQLVKGWLSLCESGFAQTELLLVDYCSIRSRSWTVFTYCTLVFWSGVCEDKRLSESVSEHSFRK